MTPTVLRPAGAREVRMVTTRPARNTLEVDYLPPFGRSEVTVVGPGAIPVAIVAVVLAAALAAAVFN